MITAYSIIKNNVSIVNGKPFLADNNTETFSKFVEQLYKKLNIHYPKFYKMDNLTKLGFINSELLLQNKNINSYYSEDEIGLVFANKSSSLDTDLKFYSTIENRNQYFPSPSVFVYTLPNIMLGEICIRNRFKGENAFFIMEKFDSEFILEYSRLLLDTNRTECCIAGWVELLPDNFESLFFLLEKKKYNNNLKTLELKNIIRQYEDYGAINH